MVTNCPLFYNDEEEPEVEEVHPLPEVVEVPLPSKEEKRMVASCPGVSSQTCMLRFHLMW